MYKLPYEHRKYAFWFYCQYAQNTKNRIFIIIRYGTHHQLRNAQNESDIKKLTCPLQFELINSSHLSLGPYKCNVHFPKNLDTVLIDYLSPRLLNKNRPKRHTPKSVFNSLICKDRIHCLMLLTRIKDTSWVVINDTTSMFERLLCMNIAEYLE